MEERRMAFDLWVARIQLIQTELIRKWRRVPEPRVLQCLFCGRQLGPENFRRRNDDQLEGSCISYTYYFRLSPTELQFTRWCRPCFEQCRFSYNSTQTRIIQLTGTELGTKN
jgi:hypothetical protein